MEEVLNAYSAERDEKTGEVTYKSDKDFYKGVNGEFRLKAEGLFKKAKEKGISIEEINIAALRENTAEFPGMGVTELPTYMVKVKGRHVASGQVIVDGKQIDYFNRYQKYLAQKIEQKNILKDEKGKAVREYGKIKLKDDPEFGLSEWELFEIGKGLVEDKEFGMEKAITGACDRVIRKLMGENDWLYPEEARLLDEEFNTVQEAIAKERENTGQSQGGQLKKKATERQINYLKAKIKNLGLDPDSSETIKEILSSMGYDAKGLEDLNTVEMSRIIDNMHSVASRLKEKQGKENLLPGFGQTGSNSEEEDKIKQ